jgi:kynurenine 3-monooxygenase
MVTFSHIDYNEALQIGKKQEKIMQEIMQIENIDSIWDSEFVEKKILSFL